VTVGAGDGLSCPAEQAVSGIIVARQIANTLKILFKGFSFVMDVAVGLVDFVVNLSLQPGL
jgi:hypothetical protein